MSKDNLEPSNVIDLNDQLKSKQIIIEGDVDGIKRSIVEFRRDFTKFKHVEFSDLHFLTQLVRDRVSDVSLKVDAVESKIEDFQKNINNKLDGILELLSKR